MFRAFKNEVVRNTRTLPPRLRKRYPQTAEFYDYYEEPDNVVASHADVYTLENLKQSPELLKPVPTTMLPQSDNEVYAMVSDIVASQTKEK